MKRFKFLLGAIAFVCLCGFGPGPFGGPSGGGTSITSGAGAFGAGTSQTGGVLTGALAAPYGATTYTAHGQIVGEGGSNLAAMAACAVGALPYGQGASADPVCSTLIFPNAATQGDLIVATSANTLGSLAAVAAGLPLLSQGTGAVPAYASIFTKYVSGTASVNAPTNSKVCFAIVVGATGGGGTSAGTTAGSGAGCGGVRFCVGPGGGATYALQYGALGAAGAAGGNAGTGATGNTQWGNSGCIAAPGLGGAANGGAGGAGIAAGDDTQVSAALSLFGGFCSPLTPSGTAGSGSTGGAGGLCFDGVNGGTGSTNTVGGTATAGLGGEIFVGCI